LAEDGLELGILFRLPNAGIAIPSEKLFIVAWPTYTTGENVFFSLCSIYLPVPFGEV